MTFVFHSGIFKYKAVRQQSTKGSKMKKAQKKQEPKLIRNGYKVELVLKYDINPDGTINYYNPIDISEAFYRMVNDINNKRRDTK